MSKTMIIITNNSNKQKILKSLSKEKKLLNLKFYTFNELKKNLFFDYDNKAIEYLINNYHINIEIALTYLNNLYFLKEINNEKIIFLNNIKQELENNNLLIKNKMFKEYIKDKEIIVYGYNHLTKEQELIIKSLNKEVTYQNDLKKYIPTVYEANDINEEVEFVVTKISELLNHKVDINKIKIIINDDYKNIIRRYFNIFNIPLNMNEEYLFSSTFIAQEFLNNTSKYNLIDNINILKEKYTNLNDLINVINKSSLVSDNNRLTFIKHDLKNTKIKDNYYDKAVNITNINDYFKDDEYVFLLGFNINFYPEIKRDDAYLSDNIKDLLGLDTSTNYNNITKENLKSKILAIKNLTITYKLKSSSGIFYPSILINEMDLEVNKIELNRQLSYSKLNTKLLYAHDLDLFNKYNIISENLSLYQNNLNIDYKTYNHKFKGLNKNLLKDHLNHELTLAYTNMESYNECAFKYYIQKILKLDIYEENFKTIIGNIVHHILELGILKDINIEKEIINYVKEKDYNLSSKEYFYLGKLSSELTQILNIIKDQKTHSKLTNYLFENELYVYKDQDDMKITFKGLIDKVMYTKNENILAIVDYKTGDTKITLDNLKYGLNIQLPIYLYLLKKSDRFKNSLIAGFYIQKVFDKIPNITEHKTLNEIKKDNMRLRGYTNSDPSIIEMLDDDYLNNHIIKDLKFKKDGEMQKTTKILSNKEMDELALNVEEQIDKCINNIIKANFSINPKVLNAKNIACEYCKFKDICFKEKQDEIILGGEDYEMDN